MENHEFAIIATGLDPESDDFADRFFEAGCDDATLGFQRGVIVLDFDREAISMEEAIMSALDNVRAAGATVIRIEPDSLVNLSDIAERTGLTRQAVALYASGKRGEGFPKPRACVTTDHPLYDWTEVAHWLADRDQIDPRVVEHAAIIRRMNQELTTEVIERELVAA